MKLSDLGPPKPGHLHGGDPVREKDIFYTCKICGQKVDMRDLRPGHVARAARPRAARDRLDQGHHLSRRCSAIAEHRSSIS